MYSVTLRRDSTTERLYAKDGESLFTLLTEAGVIIGGCGNGSCGKCRVRLISGIVSGDVPDGCNCVRACRSKIISDITIAPPAAESFQSTASLLRKDSYGQPVFAAIDVGTTTIVLRALDADGRTVAEASCPNPQASYGADLISRIKAAETHLTELCDVLTGRISRLIESIFEDSPPKKAVIAANTVMQYFLRGADPSPFGRYPMPEVQHSAVLLDSSLFSLSRTSQILLLPPISPFVGGDIVSGIISLEHRFRSSKTLLCDLGTNGELALITDGKIFTASAAAGSAFEGGGIEMGMPYGRGAIDRVIYKDGDFDVHVVGNSLPVGICGSGISSACAALLDAGILDEKGVFVKASPRIRDSRFYLTGSVYITQKDIATFLLAKAAIRTAFDILIKQSGVLPEQILVSGAFGSNTDCSSLITVSMFPNGIPISSIGNSSLDGAADALMSAEKFNEACRVAAVAETVDLALHPDFQKTYIENLKF